MRQQLRAGTLVLALFGSAGFATAQNAPGSTGAQEKFNLSQPHEQIITQGLRNQPSQSAPGYQGDVGSKLPDSMTSKALPDDVTAQVPATKDLPFRQTARPYSADRPRHQAGGRDRRRTGHDRQAERCEPGQPRFPAPVASVTAAPTMQWL